MNAAAKKGKSRERLPRNPNGWILPEGLPEPGSGERNGAAASFLDEEHRKADPYTVSVRQSVEPDMVHLLVGQFLYGIEALVEIRLQGAAVRQDAGYIREEAGIALVLGGNGPVNPDRIENDISPPLIAVDEFRDKAVQIEGVGADEVPGFRGFQIVDGLAERFLVDSVLTVLQQEQVQCPGLRGRFEGNAFPAETRKGEVESGVQADFAVHLRFGTEIVEENPIVSLVGEQVGVVPEIRNEGEDPVLDVR